MKNIQYIIVIVLLGLLSHQNIHAQCTVAETPTITTLVETNPGSGDGLITIGWDANCGNRGANSICGPNDNNSVFWYAGFYGQNSPAPNGLIIECGVRNVEAEDDVSAGGDCNGANIGTNELPISNGGQYSANLCLDAKGSTCVSQSFSQRIPAGTGTLHSWHISGADAGNDLGYCDVLPQFTIPLCPGQCYNVIMWELIIDQPTGSGDTPDAFNGNDFPFPGFDDNAACGNLTIIDESPASTPILICMSGTNTVIDNPTLTATSDLGICASTTPTSYTGTVQWQPADEGDPTLVDLCQAQDIDVQTVLDDTNPTWDGTGVDQVTGGTGDNGDVGDLSVTVGACGANPANSSNGQLCLGAHVIEVNCRENMIINFSTPLGCKGFEDFVNDYGLPPCTGENAGTTNAKVYITNNGIPVAPNSFDAFAPSACWANGSNTNTCASNMSSGYPADWTAQFGAFVGDDGDYGGTPGVTCLYPLAGNPFEGGGANPFDLPGTTTHDFGDGVVRTVSTVCVRYEDPCDGSKAATCIKFISDASPIQATPSEVQMSCAGANNGQLIITGLVGGSSDPSLAGTATDYVFLNSPSTFMPCGNGVWETAADVAPGIYTVTIQDPLAAACGSACDVELEFVIRDKLPSTIVGNATVCPDQCTTVTAVLQENPIVEYEVTGNIDPNNLVPTRGPCAGGQVTSYEWFLTPPSPPNATQCSSSIGTGAVDATLTDFCFDITANWDDITLYLDFAGGTDSEELWGGVSYTGGTDTDGGGQSTMSVCVNANGFTSGSYDGTLNGDSFGGNFNGDAADGPWVIYIQDINCGTADEFVINSASVTVTYRCVEPQPANICTLTGMDALTWTLNSGPGPDLLNLNGPANADGEFCAVAATPAGDYIYDVSGFHTSNAMIDDMACGTAQATCCPLMGQVTVSVLNVPPPPATSLTNGQEFCSGDAAVDLTFTPPLAANPGSILVANYAAGGFPNEVIFSIVGPNGPVGAGLDLEGADAGAVCGGSGGIVGGLNALAGLAINLPPANNSTNYPGQYRICVTETFGDGLNGEVFTLTDHCGNALLSNTDYDAAQCTAVCTDFTIDPNQLTVQDPNNPGNLPPGLTQTSDPDGIPNNGDEIYTFDPSAANTAAIDGSDCNVNLVNYQITTSCGCIVDETLALFVYDEPTATNPPPKTSADCSATGMITWTAAEITGGLAGGTGSYTMTYTDGSGTVGPIPVGSITIDANATTSPLIVTITDDDAAYTGMVADPQNPGGMLDCDGNACSAQMSLVFASCCTGVADPEVFEYWLCEGSTLPTGAGTTPEGLSAICQDCDGNAGGNLLTINMDEGGWSSTGGSPVSFTNTNCNSDGSTAAVFGAPGGGSYEATLTGLSIPVCSGMVQISFDANQSNCSGANAGSTGPEPNELVSFVLSDGTTNTTVGMVDVNNDGTFSTPPFMGSVAGSATTLIISVTVGDPTWDAFSIDNISFSCLPSLPFGSDIIWLEDTDNDGIGDNQVVMGDYFGPTDATVGDYSYYAVCECDYGPDGICQSNQVEVVFHVYAHDAGTATVDNQILCCGETVNFDDVTAVYDETLAGGDSPKHDYELGYAITSGSHAGGGPQVLSQADLDALPTTQVFMADAPNDLTDETGMYTTSCTACPNGTTGTLTAGVWAITPFLSVDELEVCGAVADATTNVDQTGFSLFQAYQSNYTAEGSLDNLAVPATSLSIDVNIYDFINPLFDGGGATGPGCDITDLYVDYFVNGGYIASIGPFPAAATTVNLTLADFPAGVNSNDNITIQVAIAGTAGNGCPTTGTEIDNEAYYVDYSVEYTINFDPFFDDVGEGAMCAEFGQPADFVVLDPICATDNAICDNQAATYNVMVTTSGGYAGLNGNSYVDNAGNTVNIMGEYQITTTGSTAITPAGSGNGVTTATGTGPFTITYPVSSPNYTVDIVNWDAGAGAVLGNVAADGCPIQITGMVDIPAPPTAGGFAICQDANATALNLAMQATCGNCVMGTTDITWWDVTTAGTQQGTTNANPLDPTGLTATEGTFNTTAPGDFTFHVQCECSGCPSPRTPVIVTIVDPISADTLVQQCTSNTNTGIDLNQIDINVTGGLPSLDQTNPASPNLDATAAYTFSIAGTGTYNPGVVIPDSGTPTDPGLFGFDNGGAGIPAGVYTVTISDGSGCSFDIDVEVYDELFVAAQSEACGPNQFIVTFGDGGTDPQIFPGACYDFYLVTNPTDITTTLPPGSITAYSDQDPGGAMVAAPPYNGWPYTICEPIPAPGGTTVFFDTVPEGDVYIILVDDNGCQVANQIQAGPPLAYNPVTLTDASNPCDANALTILMDDGRAGSGFLTDTYFTPQFTATINAGPSNMGAAMGATATNPVPGNEGQGTATFSGLTAGVYTIVVTDANPPPTLCPGEPAFSDTIMVNVFDPLAITNINPFCDDNNGSRLTFTFDISGGQPGFDALVGNPLTGFTVTSVTVAPPGGTSGTWDLTQDNVAQDPTTGNTTFTYSMEPATTVGTTITIDLVDDNGCTTQFTYTTTFQCCIAEAGAVTLSDICAPETVSLDCSSTPTVIIDNPNNPLPSTLTVSITGYQTFNLYDTYFLVADANGNILDVFLIATGNTGVVPIIGDIDVDFDYCYFANLAGGGLGQTYQFFSYNELTVNPPAPAPAVGLNVNQIGTLDDVCYDLSATLAQVYIPKPLTVSRNIQVDEGNMGGISPFYYNRHEIDIEGGIPPYDYIWCTEGYVRHTESTTIINSNGCPTAFIDIEYNDNAVWAVTINDANGCSLQSWRFTNDPVVEDMQQGIPAQPPGSTGSVLDAFYDKQSYVATTQCHVAPFQGTLEVCMEGGYTGNYIYDLYGPYTWNNNTPVIGFTTSVPSSSIVVSSALNFFGGAPPTDITAPCRNLNGVLPVGTNNCIRVDNLPQGWYRLLVQDNGDPNDPAYTGNANTGPNSPDPQITDQWYWIHCNYANSGGGRGKVAEQFDNGIGLIAYPNPFSNEATLEFSVAEDVNARIDVYGVDGRRVSTLFDGEIKAHETYNAMFSGANLPDGIYMIRLTTDSGLVQNQKLILAK